MEKERREESYILLEKKDWDENRTYLEVIIDTGCRSSVCGELRLTEITFSLDKREREEVVRTQVKAEGQSRFGKDKKEREEVVRTQMKAEGKFRFGETSY